MKRSGRQRREQRVHERRAGAERDERVHVGASVPHARPGAHVEVTPGPGHHERRERQQRDAEHARIDRVQPRHDAAQHGDSDVITQRMNGSAVTGAMRGAGAGDGRRTPSAASTRSSRRRRSRRSRWPCGAGRETRVRARGRACPLGRLRRRVLLRGARHGHFRFVARVANHLDQLFGRGRGRDRTPPSRSSASGGRTRRDAGRPPQRALDARLTGGAGHPLDRDLERLHRVGASRRSEQLLQ